MVDEIHIHRKHFTSNDVLNCIHSPKKTITIFPKYSENLNDKKKDQFAFFRSQINNLSKIYLNNKSNVAKKFHKSNLRTSKNKKLNTIKFKEPFKNEIFLPGTMQTTTETKSSNYYNYFLNGNFKNNKRNSIRKKFIENERKNINKNDDNTSYIYIEKTKRKLKNNPKNELYTSADENISENLLYNSYNNYNDSINKNIVGNNIKQLHINLSLPSKDNSKIRLKKKSKKVNDKYLLNRILREKANEIDHKRKPFSNLDALRDLYKNFNKFRRKTKNSITNSPYNKINGENYFGYKQKKSPNNNNFIIEAKNLTDKLGYTSTDIKNSILYDLNERNSLNNENINLLLQKTNEHIGEIKNIKDDLNYQKPTNQLFHDKTLDFFNATNMSNVINNLNENIAYKNRSFLAKKFGLDLKKKDIFLSIESIDGLLSAETKMIQKFKSFH